MSTLIEELAEVCGKNFLDEKILLVPTLAIGHQIADRLAVERTSWVNLRSETVRTLVDRVIGFDIIESGLTMLSRAQALALVEQACDEVLTEDSYFHALSGQPGLYRAVQSTLDDLRHAHVRLGDVSGERFEDRRKREELQNIQRRYEELLDEKQAIDRATLLRKATEKLRASGDRKQYGFVEPTIWLLLDGIDLTAAEDDFVRLLAGGALQTVGKETAYQLAEETVTFVQAIGEENEVRDCFRELLRDRNTLDDAELIYTHPIYLPLAYELANEYDVACTFAEGVAASFTRPGQAVLGFLQWLGSDFDAPTLRRLAASGVLKLKNEELSSSALARSIREAAIGWGRTRTVTQLEKLLAQKEAAHDEEGEAEWRVRDVARVKASLAFARTIVDSVPTPDADDCVPLASVAEAASSFVRQFAYTGSELDSIAKVALHKLLLELSEVGSSCAPLAVCATRLGDAVQTLHVAASNPRPGHLHVSSLQLAGYAKRARTFIAGVDDARFPGQPLQDPVLLDAERVSINESIAPGRLPLIAEQSLERLQAFRRLLARVAQREGSLRISYSSTNLLEGREQFPGVAMLDLFRHVSGNAEADYRTLIDAAHQHRASFIPGKPPASETEWWLAQESGPSTEESGNSPAARETLTAAIRLAYPWLADGAFAEVQRASDLFTKYDGRLNPAPEILDPRVTGTVVSCSRITLLAECPYKYFLQRVLGIQPLDELQRDPLQWLNALEFGSLFHGVAESFMNGLKGALPAEAHQTMLRAIADEALAKELERVPPPNDAAYLLRQRELHAACDFFLKSEIERGQSVKPLAFELPFGFDEDSLCALASRAPIEIVTKGGTLKIRGRIDRVDELRDRSLEVWDYKTGGTFKYNRPGRLYAGRVVQHAVYAHAVEQVMERHGDPRKIARSGYFFPTEKGGGERISREGDLSELTNLLSLLFDMVADGAFPHAGEEACRFCDLQDLCDLETSAARMERKIANPANNSAGLEAWRKIQGIP